MLLFRRAVAEFLGTAWLVFGGCGSAVRQRDLHRYPSVWR